MDIKMYCHNLGICTGLWQYIFVVVPRQGFTRILLKIFHVGMAVHKHMLYNEKKGMGCMMPEIPK